jgi:hypothetical protein
VKEFCRARRSCLALIAALPLGLSRWGRLSSSADPHGQEWPFAELGRLATVILPPDSAQKIGRIYLGAHPDPDLEAGLLKALWPEADPFLAHGPPAPRELRLRLAAAVREDFRQRRIVHVDNWHLALTEARLCGLIALQA